MLGSRSACSACLVFPCCFRRLEVVDSEGAVMALYEGWVKDGPRHVNITEPHGHRSPRGAGHAKAQNPKVRLSLSPPPLTLRRTLQHSKTTCGPGWFSAPVKGSAGAQTACALFGHVTAVAKLDSEAQQRHRAAAARRDRKRNPEPSLAASRDERRSAARDTASAHTTQVSQRSLSFHIPYSCAQHLIHPTTAVLEQYTRGHMGPMCA